MFWIISNSNSEHRIEYFEQHFYGWENIGLPVFTGQKYPPALTALLTANSGSLNGHSRDGTINIMHWVKEQ
jgi:hypothetical protein